MKTVGLPKRLSFETGPYFSILCCSHFSAVLARMARRRPRLWPIMGSPNEPGGTLFGDLFLLAKRSKMGMRRRKTVKKRVFMICEMLCLWSDEEEEFNRS